MDYSQLLFLLTILELSLKTCLELKFSILFLVLLFLHHLLKAASVVNLQIRLYRSTLLHFLTAHYNHIHQEINLQDHIFALFYFYYHLITHSIYDNKFLENHYKILGLYHIHLFFSSLYFLFVDLNYLNCLIHQRIFSEKNALI